MRFFKKATEIVAEIKIKVEPKIGINHITKMKPKVWAKTIFLASLVGLLKLVDLDYTDLRRVELDAEFLRRFSFLVLFYQLFTRFFLKQAGYTIKYKFFKILK